MLNTFLVEVINTFSDEELDAFKLFLDSPFFNHGFNTEKIKQLNVRIRVAKTQSRLAELDKSEVFEHIFPNSPMVEGKLDKLIAEYRKLLQTFLSVQQYLSGKNEATRSLHVLEDLRLRGLEERYFQLLEKNKKDLENSAEETLEHQKNLYFLAREEHEWHSTFNKAKGDLNIPAAIQHLDKYYFTERTSLLNVLLIQNKVTILPTSALHPLEQGWEVPAAAREDSILLRLSWEVYNLLHLPEPPIEQFQELLSQLQTHEKRIDKWHLVGLYAHLRNLCAVLINEGHDELRGLFHEIHKDNLARGYFYFDGKIPSSSVLSITQTALSIQMLEWADQFVEAHKNQIIGENDTQDFYRMNKALCLFAGRQYDAALDIIPFGSSYSFYHLMARRLELKIYYELDSDLLPYKIDAFKMFISRAGSKVLSENQHELHASFINFLRQLSTSPEGTNKARSTQIIKRIEEKKLVGERSWLLEKARELGRRRK